MLFNKEILNKHNIQSIISENKYHMLYSRNMGILTPFP